MNTYNFRYSIGKEPTEHRFANVGEAIKYVEEKLTHPFITMECTVIILDEKGGLLAVVEKDQHLDINTFY